jgi:hypothetical protein
LGEEFAFCGSPTDYQVDVLRCASGLGNVLTNQANYGNESFLTLEQTGLYWGDDSIREYSSLADDTIPGEAILVDSCWISPDLKLKINQVEGTYCDVTASAILGATFQPNLSGENILALEATAGYRTTYHVADDGDSFPDVEVYRLFLTDPSQNGLFNIEEEYIPPRICQVLENACGEQYFHFSSQAECISAMSTLPFVQVNDFGSYVYTGNSTGCRMIHSAMANLNPELHCPHISWFSEPDRNGNYKCDDKNLAKFYHNFTADDMKLFERVAAINELDDDPSLSHWIPVEDRLPCVDLGQAEILQALDDAGELQGLDIPCFAYLSVNEAFSSHTASYWYGLLALTLGFRLLSSVLLRIRTVSA